MSILPKLVPRLPPTTRIFLCIHFRWTREPGDKVTHSHHWMSHNNNYYGSILKLDVYICRNVVYTNCGYCLHLPSEILLVRTYSEANKALNNYTNERAKIGFVNLLQSYKRSCDIYAACMSFLKALRQTDHNY